MTRCVCCNEKLSVSELKVKKSNGDEEDLCFRCKPQAINPDSIPNWVMHEKAHKRLTDGDVWFFRQANY